MHKQSDSEKLEQLYTRYEQKMYVVAFSVLHNEWQAEDAVQEAFVRLLRNIRKLKDVESVKTRTYVLNTIKSTAIDQYRRNQAQNKQCVPLGEMEIADKRDDTMEIIGRLAGKMVLDEILGELPETYRDVIMYRCVHQLSVKETAAVLEITEEAVRKRQQRAMQKIRKTIGDGEDAYSKV